MSLSTIIDRYIEKARIDLEPTHVQPSVPRLVVATVLSIGGSLLADALLVAIGISMFPSTKGYGHFQFHDYARLTVVGVIIACVAWPVVTRVTSDPRWIFLRLAVLVTLVLFLPDAWILAKGQPPKAVAVLVVMHLAIAVVTYNLLVRFAPVESGPGRRGRPETSDWSIPSGRVSSASRHRCAIIDLAHGAFDDRPPTHRWPRPQRTSGACRHGRGDDARGARCRGVRQLGRARPRAPRRRRCTPRRRRDGPRPRRRPRRRRPLPTSWSS